MRTVYLNAAYFPAVELLSAVATAVILLYGGNQVIDGAVTIGVLASFVFYLQSFFDPIQQLSQLYTTYQAGMAALDKIFELLDEEPDIARPPGRRRAAARCAARSTSTTCRSPTADERAGARATSTLHVPPGQTVALVGATGAGKSTLAKLVARFYDPDRRAGADRRPRPARGDRALAALAARDRAPGGLPVLGHDPRQHRLRAPGARATRTCAAAAAAVGADEFIERLPDGYDTEVGERGGHLSAGQRQLVAFARAAAADPRILILDEATSNVDVHTEARIEHGLRRLLAGRTAIVIAHRLSTIRAPAGSWCSSRRPDRRAGHARRADRGRRRLRAALPRLGGAGRGLDAVLAILVSPLGGRLMARRQPLELVIGVRVPAPQPDPY